MNTPAHLIIGAAAMARGRETPIIWAAFAGALAPDVSLYLMAGVSLFVLAIPPQVVFDELYFSPAWQTVFAIDNSVFVWGALLAVAVWQRAAWAIALSGAALIHLGLDFPLHHDDGRPHFWPLSGWVFESPLSYWDRRQGAGWIAPLEAFVTLIAAVLLWRTRPGRVASATIIVLLAAELWIVRQWLFFFVDG
ncbi:MAG: cobalamin biosynthesis protein CobQ [Pseudomonadota bacterium]